jgi:hypothetical protein
MSDEGRNVVAFAPELPPFEFSKEFSQSVSAKGAHFLAQRFGSKFSIRTGFAHEDGISAWFLCALYFFCAT